MFVAVHALQGGDTRRIHPVEPWSLPRQRFVGRVARAYGSWGSKACVAAAHHCRADWFDGMVASEVRIDPRGARLAWVERLGPAEGEHDGPLDFHTHVLVTCDRAAGGTATRCRERAFGNYDGPEGKETLEVLDAALAPPGRE